jgi:uncharacterized protein YvpB
MERQGQLGGHAAETKLCQNTRKISEIRQLFEPLQMQTCESFSVKMVLVQAGASGAVFCSIWLEI